MKKPELQHLSIALCVICLVLLFSFFDTWNVIEYELKDRLYQEERMADSRIVIIAIDQRSLDALGRWPWSRNIHSTLITQLQKANVRAIGLDIIFSGKSQNGEEDRAFSSVLHKYDNIVLPVHRDQQRWVEPIPSFAAAAVLGHIQIFQERDSIVRNYAVSVHQQGKTYNSFSWELAKIMMPDLPSPASYGDHNEHSLLPISFAGKAGHFETISYMDIYNGAIPAEYLHDKVILVGSTVPGLFDHYLTAMDKNQPMSGVEIHANVLQQLLEERSSRYPSDTFNLLVILGIGLVGYFLFTRFTLFTTSIYLLLVGSTLLFAAHLASEYGGLFIQIFYPLLMLFLIYIVSISYRYVREFQGRIRVTRLFGRFVSPQVVSEIIKKRLDQVTTGGQRRQITVLFIDIRGFTSMSGEMDCEEVVLLINDFLDWCTRIVFEQEGTVDKFLGDGMMALFNAPVEQPDHVERAVKTAQAMRETGKSWSDQLVQTHGKHIEFGIGIHTGEAVIGNIGSSRRLDYTAIGDTVNLASRLESKAKGNQILLSGQVVEALPKESYPIRFAGHYDIKGKKDPIPLYELLDR